MLSRNDTKGAIGGLPAVLFAGSVTSAGGGFMTKYPVSLIGYICIILCSFIFKINDLQKSLIFLGDYAILGMNL